MYHVATTGNDAWSGTLAQPNRAGTDGPFRTLVRARDAIRELKKTSAGLPVGGITVEIQGGRYELDQPFALEQQDSGTNAAPVVYRAAAGDEVRIVGGRAVGDWKPVTDPAVLDRLDPAARGQVLCADLRAQGITDLPPLTAPRWAQSDPGAELFYRDQPMTLSRWPNEGYSYIADLVVQDGWKIHGQPGSRVGQFVYDGDRPERWLGEKEVWLHGYWFWDWADQRMRVRSIDTAKKQIELEPKPDHSFGFRKGRWYYAFNLLCELDQPGEWYLDREAGLLYFWPPGPIRPGDAVVSCTSGLATLDGVSQVTLAGLVFEAGRGTAVTIRDGEGCSVLGCTIRNMASGGVQVSGGTGHRVAGCDLYNLGEGGISLTGGDRPTLTRGNHVAENNHIHHCSRWNLLYHPGIQLTGVGLRAAHNLLHDLPHVAIGFTGNEHCIEYNEMHNVVFQANDAGAIYTTGATETWTMRGHVIRYNYLHDIDGFEGRGCQGVYLDDAFSSIHLYGNLFERVHRAAFIGGGRDNIYEKNLFVDCAIAVHIDARGLGWMAGSEPGLTKELQSLPIDRPPWSTRYPQLQTVLANEPMAPVGNIVRSNVCVGGRWDGIQNAARKYTTIENNLVDEDPHFVNAAKGNYRLRPDSPAFALGFEPIPYEKIGCYRSPERASWPVLHAVHRVPVASVQAPPAAKRLAPPKHAALARTAAPATIDGTLAPGEWTAPVLSLAEGIHGEKVTPASRAWLAHDGTALLIAFENPIEPTGKLQTQPHWGVNDAVEIAIRNPAGGDQAPILVLRGYVDGSFESSQEAGAPQAATEQAAKGVTYAAKIVNPALWTAEWRIPFASLGIDPTKPASLPFNLSVRKPAGDKWIMWQGTNGSTWLVTNTGLLDLVP